MLPEAEVPLLCDPVAAATVAEEWVLAPPLLEIEPVEWALPDVPAAAAVGHDAGSLSQLMVGVEALPQPD
jgi:hypothetical protein